MTAARFALGIDKFMKQQVRQEAAKLLRYIALDALNQLVQMTPVDTGRARGNWVVSIGQAVAGYDEGRTDKVGGDTFSAGAGVIGRITKDPFNVILIQNNLPYIEALEHGHSKQAPAGMLSVTFANLEARYK